MTMLYAGHHGVSPGFHAHYQYLGLQMRSDDKTGYSFILSVVRSTSMWGKTI